jgi:MinD-like ATPase involved in chromosome partitioning or flagellar assembly
MLRVATALTDAVRESRVVQVISAMPDAVLVRRCRDIVELRAVAHASQVDAVIVDAGLRGLDRDVVTNLVAVGVRLVALRVDDVGDPVGLDGTSVVEDLQDLPEALQQPAAQKIHLEQPFPADPGSGRVVAVWGPVGSPGRTTVAIELAAALSRQGDDVMLLDVDTTGPSVAQLMGLIDDTSGVAAAARLAAERSLTPDDLAGLAVAIPSGPRILVGLPATERWIELRSGSVDEVLRCARGTVPWTLADIGAGIEGHDLDWAEPDAPQRYSAARATLATADAVVCVGRTDPVGLSRLLRELPKVRSLAPTAMIEVILNRSSSRADTRQASELVKDLAGVVPRHFPDDAGQVRKAQLLGVPVAELSGGSPLVGAVDQLADEVREVLGSYDRVRERSKGSHRRFLRGAHRRYRHRDAGVV